MFASKSLVEHVSRGVIGFGAAVVATALAESHPLLAIAAIPFAFVAFRGCPMCWTVGVFQTVSARLRGTSTDGLCTDGSCALRERRA